MKVMVQDRLQVETRVVQNAEWTSSVSGAKYLLVLLTVGLLEDPGFAQLLLAATAAGQRSDALGHGHVGPVATMRARTMFVGGARNRGSANIPPASGLEFVTVNADPRFQFPGLDFFTKVEQEGLGRPDLGLGPDVGPKLASAYRSLLSILALPFSPHGSEGILDRQVSEICRRFRGLDSHAEAEASVKAEAGAEAPADSSQASVHFASEQKSEPGSAKEALAEKLEHPDVNTVKTCI